MLALNRSDIEDIANGRHNRYVESVSKDEFLRELASRLLKATLDTSDIDDKLDDIRDKLYDANEYLNEVRDVLQSITE